MMFIPGGYQAKGYGGEGPSLLYVMQLFGAAYLVSMIWLGNPGQGRTGPVVDGGTRACVKLLWWKLNVIFKWMEHKMSSTV